MAYIEPNFKKYAVKKYSRFGEDGLIEYLVNTIESTSKFTDKHPYLVEIGVHPNESNTLALIQNKEWNGIWADMEPFPVVPNDGLKRFPIRFAWVKKSNINILLSEFGVPWDFDLFSLDIDGNDYWVWKEMMFQPRIVVIEYNAHHLIDESKVILYEEYFKWKGDRYYGASLKALNNLAIEKEYTLIAAYCHNAFFVRNDCIDNPEDFKYEEIYEYLPIHCFPKEDREWVDV